MRSYLILSIVVQTFNDIKNSASGAAFFLVFLHYYQSLTNLMSMFYEILVSSLFLFSFLCCNLPSSYFMLSSH